MRIAITGPTGNIGRRLTNNLLDRGGHELVLLARDPSKLAAEQARGATVAKGDIVDEGFVLEATKGADALFWLCPPDFTVHDYRGYYASLASIAAAAIEANEIPHTVLVSSVGAHLPEGTGPIAGLHDAEEILSGATQGLTILRPTFFMENYLFQVDAIKGASSVFMPVSGDITFPMIATADIGDRAAEAIVGPAPSSPQIIALHGPRDVSMDEAARLIGQGAGRSVNHVRVEPAQAKESFVQMGMSEGVADTMLEMYAAFQAGKIVPEGTPETTPTTFETFVDGVLKPAVQG